MAWRTHALGRAVTWLDPSQRTNHDLWSLERADGRLLADRLSEGEMLCEN
jgi:hypothetical protein